MEEDICLNQIIDCKSRNNVTLILKLVDYCNFNCDFCRYPNNKNPKTMSFEVYSAAVEKACIYNLAQGNPRLSIIYHGGEPLLWGIDNFRRAIQFQLDLKKRFEKLEFRNSIQTNGFFLNHKWICFFKENRFNIGVSIDGPSEINFHKNSSNNTIVLNNLKLLHNENCHYGILSVITNEHAGWADRYYDFLIQNDIHSVGFCYCVYDEEKRITVSNEILTDFLKRLFELYYHGEYYLSIREFDSVIKLCLGVMPNMCTFSYRSGCGNYYSIRPDGDILFCDPFTLGGKVLGNIMSESFYIIKTRPEILEIKRNAKMSIIKECGTCKIKDICGGGCYRNLFGDEKNVFCDTFKSIYPYIKETVLKTKRRRWNDI